MSGSLEEIRNWKLEAKFEDTEKYFYEFSAVDRLTSGDKFFVVGRKGTGKTAISEYLRKINKYDVFAEKLTFRNFPSTNYICDETISLFSLISTLPCGNI